MKVRLIAKTTGAPGTEYEGKSLDEIIVGTARVSSSRETNELFSEPYKLIRHCAHQGHWSIFEQANLNIEVKTSRAVGREILRHSLKPQEFSQRYAIATEFEPIELRVQGKGNRQMSDEVVDSPLLECIPAGVIESIKIGYDTLLDNNVSRETARMILPEATTTVMNLNGDVRTWISFLSQRLHKTAQKEIRMVAEEVRDIFMQELPIVSKALFDFENAYEISVFDRLVIEKYVKKGQINWVD